MNTENTTTDTVTINITHLEDVIRNYLTTLVYEDEIPQKVDMAITLLAEAGRIGAAIPTKEILVLVGYVNTDIENGVQLNPEWVEAAEKVRAWAAKRQV